MYISLIHEDKELVELAEPNRQVKHTDGWEAVIYVDPELLKRARTGGTKAQNKICNRFRNACEVKYGQEFLDRKKRFIKWNDLTITTIVASADDADPIEAASSSSNTIPGWTGDCCEYDNCEWCIGHNKGAPDHRRCEHGCTLKKVS